MRELGIGDAGLLAQSRYDPFRRTYLKDNKVHKLVILHKEVTAQARANDLAGEYEVLRQCAGLPGVPRTLDYRRTDSYELLVLEHMPGTPLSQMETSWRQLAEILLKLSAIVWRMCWRGVSHNDVKPDNILVASSGLISIIDFDQATRTNFFTALIQSTLGVRLGRAQVRGSLAFIVARRLLRGRVSPRVVRALRKLLRDEDAELEQGLPTLPENASPQARALLTAWKLAQRSDASSPGRNVAYYSLEFEGIHFPGERSWKERWEVLRGVTDYTGKRVLELGCNMALLSSFLLREEGARAALAVDADKQILEAARIVGSALNVTPLLQQVNLDDPDDWETQLLQFRADVVFALNILNWVPSKQRLLKFLGSFPELVFEGHDDLDTEVNRLRAVGFEHISVAATTERGRQILLCRQHRSTIDCVNQ